MSKKLGNFYVVSTCFYADEIVIKYIFNSPASQHYSLYIELNVDAIGDIGMQQPISLASYKIVSITYFMEEVLVIELCSISRGTFVT